MPECPYFRVFSFRGYLLCFFRVVYGISAKNSAVFCNLTAGNRGKPMVNEAFRKMMKKIIDGKYIIKRIMFILTPEVPMA